MMTAQTPLERRLRTASLLVVIGLVIELGSLLWSHPIAFLVFVIAGGLCMLVGIAYYVWSLVILGY